MATIITRLVLNNADFARKLNISQRQVRKFSKNTMTLGAAAGAAFNPLLGTLGAMPLKFAGPIGAVATLGATLAKSTQNAMEFETALKGLSAVTGVTGTQLDALGNAATRLSNDSTSSVVEVLESYEAVAQKMPALAGNVSGIVETTAQAMNIADASGKSLTESVTILTGVLAQFGAGAEDAARYTNALMAATVNGSLTVDGLAEALTVCGASAVSAGISIEQLLGIINAVSPRFKNAAQVGTQLRTVLATLEKQDESLRPSVVGVDEAIKALGERCHTDKDYIDIFGNRCYLLAEAMVETRTAAAANTEALTGTSAAIDQARERTDTLEVSLGKLSNKWNNFIRELNGSTGVLKTIVDGLGEIVDIMADATMSEGDRAIKMSGIDTAKTESEISLARKQLEGQRDFYQSMLATPHALSFLTPKKSYEDALAQVEARLAELDKAEQKARDEAAVISLPEVEVVGHKAAESIKATIGAAAEAEEHALTGSIDWYEDKISELRKEWRATNIDEFRRELAAEIESYEGQLARVKAGVGVIPTQAATGATGAMLQPLDTGKRLDEQISTISATPMQTLEVEPGKNRDLFGTAITDVAAANTGLGGLSDIAETLGLDAAADAIKDVTSVLTALLGVVDAVTTVIQAVQVFTQGTQLASTTANTAALTANTAALVANTAATTASSALGGLFGGLFAGGGIVGGTSFSGDKVPIRANSGEMVLTRRQQSSLFDMIDKGIGGGRSLNVQVEGVLTGETIYLQQRNYKRATGKV